MTINVSLEPEEFRSMVAERCVFCHVPTRHWYVPKNQPVCEDCASTAVVRDIPSKGKLKTDTEVTK